MYDRYDSSPRLGKHMYIYVLGILLSGEKKGILPMY